MLKLKFFIVLILINIIVLQENSGVYTEETTTHAESQNNTLEEGGFNQENDEPQNIGKAEEKVKENIYNQQQIEQEVEEVIFNSEEITTKEPQMSEDLQQNTIGTDEALTQSNLQENTEKNETNLSDLHFEGAQTKEENEINKNIIGDQDSDFAQTEIINNDSNDINTAESNDNENLSQQIIIESKNNIPGTQTLENDNNNNNNSNDKNQGNNNNDGNNYNSEFQQSNDDSNDNIEYINTTQEEATPQNNLDSTHEITQDQKVDEVSIHNPKEDLEENNKAPTINEAQIMPENKESEENESHLHSENIQNKKKKFSNEKINNVIGIFEKYLIKVHSDIKTYIPYPYDLLFFSVLGYCFIWLFCCGKCSSMNLKKPRTVTDQNVFVIDKVNILQI